MSRRNEVTVLLVEGDDVDAEAVSRSFAKNSVQAELQRAGSGAQALDILRAKRPIKKAYAHNVAGYFTKSNLSDLITVLNRYIDAGLLPAA